MRTIVLALTLLGCSETGPPPGAVRVRAASAVEATLYVDAIERGPLRDGLELELDPGDHVLEARVGVQVARREAVVVRPEMIVDVDLTLPAAPTAAPLVPLPPSEPPSPPPIPTAPPPFDGPRQTPSRSDVVGAMNGVSASISACGQGAHGLAPVRLVFRSDGHVDSATVSGGNFPGPVRSCIERAARVATVPPFTNPSFSVNYPFRL